MKRFLHLLHPRPLDLHVRTWERELSADLCSTLFRERILHEAPPATWYPCGGACGKRRRVVAVGRAGEAQVAACAIGTGCPDEAVAEADLRQYGQSFPRFVEVLRVLLGVRGDGLPEGVAADIFRIGEEVGVYGPTDVFVALAPSGAAFNFFLDMRAGAGRASLVLVTTSRWLSESVVMAHGPGQRVELARIDDLIEVRAGRIARRQHPALVAHATPPPTFAYALDAGGRAPLTEAEYAARFAFENALDLFIDGVEQKRLADDEAEGFVGSVRRRDGGRERFSLKPKEAAALFELAERKTYVAARELRALAGVTHPEKLLRRTRARFDDKPYRFVRTRRGESKKTHAYLFAPNANLSWLILLPAVAPGR